MLLFVLCVPVSLLFLLFVRFLGDACCFVDGFLCVVDVFLFCVCLFKTCLACLC